MPPRYVAYATVEVLGGVAIDVIDAEADTVLRRIPSAGIGSPMSLAASSDGSWLASFNGTARSGVTLFDLRTESVVTVESVQVETGDFLPGGSRLVVHHRDSTIVYNVPELTVDTSMSFGRLYGVHSRRQNEIAAVVRHLNSAYNSFIRLATDDWRIIDSFTFVSPMSDGGILALSTVFSQDGNRIFVLGADAAGAAVFSYNVGDHSMLFRVPVESVLGRIQATPNGDELWISQSYSNLTYPPPQHLGYVLVIDADTGVPIDTIRTTGLSRFTPQWPLNLRQIAFHPLGKIAFVAALENPGLLVVDTETKEVVSLLYEDDHISVFDIAISP